MALAVALVVTRKHPLGTLCYPIPSTLTTRKGCWNGPGSSGMYLTPHSPHRRQGQTSSTAVPGTCAAQTVPSFPLLFRFLGSKPSNQLKHLTCRHCGVLVVGEVSLSNQHRTRRRGCARDPSGHLFAEATLHLPMSARTFHAAGTLT